MNWKPIPNTDGRYEASDTGLIRSLCSRHGLRKKPLIMTPTRNNSGHLRVNILGKIRPVHQLVLEAFVGPRKPGQETRHLDGKPYRNRLENICWGTREENTNDKTRHNKRRGYTILTPIQVLLIRSSPARNWDLAELFGVTDSQIYSIKKRKTWTWL